MQMMILRAGGHVAIGPHSSFTIFDHQLYEGEFFKKVAPLFSLHHVWLWFGRVGLRPAAQEAKEEPQAKAHLLVREVHSGRAETTLQVFSAASVRYQGQARRTSEGWRTDVTLH